MGRVSCIEVDELAVPWLVSQMRGRPILKPANCASTNSHALGLLSTGMLECRQATSDSCSQWVLCRVVPCRGWPRRVASRHARARAVCVCVCHDVMWRGCGVDREIVPSKGMCAFKSTGTNFEEWYQPKLGQAFCPMATTGLGHPSMLMHQKCGQYMKATQTKCQSSSL